MRFHCPKCDAKYRITEEKLTEKPNAKMRCKDCSEIFSVQEAIAAEAQRATESPRSENEAQLLANESPTVPPPRGPLPAPRAQRPAPLAGGLGRGTSLGTALGTPRPLGAGVKPLGQNTTGSPVPTGSRPIGSMGAPTRPFGSSVEASSSSVAPRPGLVAPKPLREGARAPVPTLGKTLSGAASSPGALPPRAAPSRLPTAGLGRSASVLGGKTEQRIGALSPSRSHEPAPTQMSSTLGDTSQSSVDNSAEGPLPAATPPQSQATLAFGFDGQRAGQVEADHAVAQQSLEVSASSLPPQPVFGGAPSISSEDALTPQAPPIPTLSKTTPWDSFAATGTRPDERHTPVHSPTVESEGPREEPRVEFASRDEARGQPPSKATPEVFTASMDEYSPVPRRRSGSFLSATLAAVLFGIGGFGAGYAVGVKQQSGAPSTAHGTASASPVSASSALAVDARRALSPAPPPPPPDDEPASQGEGTEMGAKSADGRKKAASTTSKAGDDSLGRSGAQANQDSLGGLALGSGLAPTPGGGGPRSASPAGVGLEASAIQSTVQKNQNAVKRSCWQPALTGRSADAPSSARITTTIQIAPSGVVSSVKHSGDPRGYPGLAACVATRVKGWTFPKSTATTTAEIPFVFAAQ